MKTLNWKVTMAAFILPLFIVLICALPLQAGETSVKTLTEQMKAGETGSTGGGSPPGPFGEHWVHLQEKSTVDSYDSRIGDYSISHGSDVNVGSNCDPNDSTAGVHLDNNATVKGGIMVTTPEEESDISIGVNAQVVGTQTYNSVKWELLPLTMPGWHTEAGGGPGGQIDGSYGSKPGTYEITNNNFRAYNNAEVTLHAGTYHFDNFEMSNNVTFQMDPNIGEDEVIEIYVGNSIVLENNSETLPPIKFTGDSTKLRFYFNGTNQIDLSNNVTFYGFIYAPHAVIKAMNNYNIFGNLVGEEVLIQNNAAIHYDKALLDKDFGSIFAGGIPAAPHKRVDWKEIIIAE